MQIAVIGSGYVGLVTGACFAEFGVDVKEAVEQSLVIFLAVGTPPLEDGSADLQFVETVAQTIARYMNGYKVIVTKSTVPIGTGERLRRLIRENQLTKTNFGIVSNPEFLREGAAIDDFMRPDRIVIGSSDEEAIAIMRDLYRPLYLIETPILITSTEAAELSKYAANAFLATKISFINEIANLCDRIGCDVHDVARAMGMDRRIGNKFLHPGPGYGGSCFPKDTRALAAVAKEFGASSTIVDSVIEVNLRQRELMVAKIEGQVGHLEGKAVTILGLSFKPETDDMRDAPAVDIIKALQAKGALITAYDPVAMDEARKVFPDLKYSTDEYAAVNGADALIFITEWNQFRALDMERVRTLMRSPKIVDLRNIYKPAAMREMGFDYVGVGR